MTTTDPLFQVLREWARRAAAEDDAEGLALPAAVEGRVAQAIHELTMSDRAVDNPLATAPRLPAALLFDARGIPLPWGALTALRDRADLDPEADVRAAAQAELDAVRVSSHRLRRWVAEHRWPRLGGLPRPPVAAEDASRAEAEAGEGAKAPRAYSREDLRRWYPKYVAEQRAAGTEPKREAQLEAARAAGFAVNEQEMRALRREFAPDLARPGRRRTDTCESKRKRE